MARHSLMVSLEDEEVVTQPDESAAIDAEAARSAGAAAEASRDVEDISDDIDGAGDAVGELGEIHGVIQDKVDSGEGLDETEAKMATIAVESIYNKLGLSTRNLIALEDFEEGKDTKEKTEGFGAKVWATIKRIFQAIINGIREFATRIKNLVKKLFGRSKTTDTQIKLLENKVEKKAEELKPEPKRATEAPEIKTETQHAAKAPEPKPAEEKTGVPPRKELSIPSNVEAALTENGEITPASVLKQIDKMRGVVGMFEAAAHRADASIVSHIADAATVLMANTAEDMERGKADILKRIIILQQPLTKEEHIGSFILSPFKEPEGGELAARNFAKARFLYDGMTTKFKGGTFMPLREIPEALRKVRELKADHDKLMESLDKVCEKLDKAGDSFKEVMATTEKEHERLEGMVQKRAEILKLHSLSVSGTTASIFSFVQPFEQWLSGVLTYLKLSEEAA